MRTLSAVSSLDREDVSVIVKLDELTEMVDGRGEVTVEVAEEEGEVAGNVGLPLAEGGGVGVILPTVEGKLNRCNFHCEIRW